MTGARWSAAVVTLRRIVPPWRPLAGLLLAVLGLFVLPTATTHLMAEPGPGTTRSTGPPGLSGSWIPTARTPRIADTTVLVEATRTGARVTRRSGVTVNCGAPSS